MALNITFDGYVQEVKQFQWGTVAVVSHAHRAKDDNGQWQTVGRDYIDVTLPDGFTAEQDTKVRVTGSLKVDAYTNKNGEAKPRLKVRATDFGLVDVNQYQGTTAPVAEEDLPF
jgi:single-stranded DNA-binding protein